MPRLFNAISFGTFFILCLSVSHPANAYSIYTILKADAKGSASDESDKVNRPAYQPSPMMVAQENAVTTLIGNLKASCESLNGTLADTICITRVVATVSTVDLTNLTVYGKAFCRLDVEQLSFFETLRYADETSNFKYCEERVNRLGYSDAGLK